MSLRQGPKDSIHVLQNNRKFVTIWIIGMTALCGAHFIMAIQALDTAYAHAKQLNWFQVVGILQLLCTGVSVYVCS